MTYGFGFDLFQHRESKMKFELTDELKRHHNRNTFIAVSSGIRASLEPKPLLSRHEKQRPNRDETDRAHELRFELAATESEPD